MTWTWFEIIKAFFLDVAEEERLLRDALSNELQAKLKTSLEDVWTSAKALTVLGRV
jgi:hypothetical protein